MIDKHQGDQKMKFQEAVKILACKLDGDYYDDALRIAQDLTSRDGDKDGLVQWVYNGDYDGSETAESLQGELDETEDK